MPNKNIDTPEKSKPWGQTLRAGEVQLILNNIEPPLSDAQISILDAELSNQKWGVQATKEDLEQLLDDKFKEVYSQEIIDRIKQDIKEGKIDLKNDVTKQIQEIKVLLEEYRKINDSYNKQYIDNNCIKNNDVVTDAVLRNVAGTITASHGDKIPKLTSGGQLNVPKLNTGELYVYSGNTLNINGECGLLYRTNDNVVRFTDNEQFFNVFTTPPLNTYMHSNYYDKTQSDGKYVKYTDLKDKDNAASGNVPRFYLNNLNGPYKSYVTLNIPYLELQTTANIKGVPNINYKSPGNPKANYSHIMVRDTNNDLKATSIQELKYALDIGEGVAKQTDVNILTNISTANTKLIEEVRKEKRNISDSYSRAEIDAKIDRAMKQAKMDADRNIPIGTIIILPYSGYIPENYMVCDGRVLWHDMSIYNSYQEYKKTHPNGLDLGEFAGDYYKKNHIPLADIATVDYNKHDIRFNVPDINIEYKDLYKVLGQTYKNLKPRLKTVGFLHHTTYIAGGVPEKFCFQIPDLRGKFIRGLGSYEDGISEPLGQTQNDAIRNITGSLSTGHSLGLFARGMGTGAFQNKGSYQGSQRGNDDYHYQPGVDFDASRVVPTASENRPYNMSMIFAIKVKHLS